MNFSKYKITKLLGEGTFGKVYLMEYKGKKIVGKYIDSESIIDKMLKKDKTRNRDTTTAQVKNIIKREIEILKIIKDLPNVIKFFGNKKIKKDGKTYDVIYMEYFDGIESGEVGKRYFQDKRKLLKFIFDLSSVLYSLHEKNWVHRDIKAENVMISKDKFALIDFNLSCSTDRDLEYKDLEKDFLICKKTRGGTRHYMAPEVISGNIKHIRDLKKSDVWSMGVLIYVLVYRVFPFDAKNKEDTEGLKKSILSQEPKYDFPDKDINKIIQRCLVKDISKRADAKEIYDMVVELYKNNPKITDTNFVFDIDKRKWVKLDSIKKVVKKSATKKSATKKCPEKSKLNDTDHICNPLSGRWVKKTTKKGKEVMALLGVKEPKHVEKKTKKIKIKVVKKKEVGRTKDGCIEKSKPGEEYICNPITHRWVKKSSKKGKEILKSAKKISIISISSSPEEKMYSIMEQKKEEFKNFVDYYGQPRIMKSAFNLFQKKYKNFCFPGDEKSGRWKNMGFVWNSDKNKLIMRRHIMEGCKNTDKRFILIPLTLEYRIDKERYGHQNIIIIDNKNKNISIYEPHGKTLDEFKPDIMLNKLQEAFAKYKIYYEDTTCPKINKEIFEKSFQSIKANKEQKEKLRKVKDLEKKFGFCVPWTIFYVELLLRYENENIQEVHDKVYKYLSEKNIDIVSFMVNYVVGILKS